MEHATERIAAAARLGRVVSSKSQMKRWSPHDHYEYVVINAAEGSLGPQSLVPVL